MSKYDSDDNIYCYPGTDILKNKFGIKDENLLIEAEFDSTWIKLCFLKENPILGDFDFKHLQKIHEFIFEDIYDFAGKIRKVQIHKDQFSFCGPQYITESAEKIFEELKNENFLKDIHSIEKFCERIAYYSAELNVLHPFREGNGRSLREFIRCLALQSNYILDFSDVDRFEYLNAMIKSVYDESDLTELYLKSIKKI